MPISENIKALRERFDLTQAQLGEIAGVSDKAVSTWENGANTPRMGAIQRMADYFQIPKSDIIEDKEKPVDKFDELDRLGADLLTKLLPKGTDILTKLNSQEWNRVLDFAAGLLAARSEESSPRE